jgi:hypothetical protein
MTNSDIDALAEVDWSSKPPEQIAASLLALQPLVSPDRNMALIGAAATTILALRDQVERMSLDGIHSCGFTCQRTACVLRREIEALRGQLAKAEEAFNLADEIACDAIRYGYYVADGALGKLAVARAYFAAQEPTR